MICRSLASVLVTLSLAVPLHAEPPSPWEFLGYEAGARFTPHHRIVDYFEMLARESEMITVETRGETWEGRPLILAIIGSPENIARLDEIRIDLDRLSDPRRTSLEEAKEISKRTPAVVWLAYGVHGNESSSAEAAMATASWLLSDEAAPIREHALVLIDPLENPDGRERYVNWFHQKLGTEPNPSPDAVEHSEPWPGGRYNHYLLDMNRDWAWATQPETRARIEIFRTWHPQVVVDFHEMGYDDTYFFPPPASPVNYNVDPDVTEWLETFGRANAAVFSEKGWPFFVRESFDLFYPGYGDSWPSLRGAIGMTYEVAGHSRAGLLVERTDGTTWSLAERIEQHATASISTVRTTAENHEELLMHAWSSARRSMQNPRTFLLLPGATAFDDAIDLLQTQGIEVSFLREPVTQRAIRIGSGEQRQTTFPANTAVVSTAQPLGGFIKTVLEQSPALPPEFVDEQRERVDADEYAEFYDLTGWSVPIAFNIEAWESSAPIRPDSLSGERPRSTGSFSNGSYGWIIDGFDPAVYRTVAALLRAGVRFGVTPEAFRFEGRQFARGTLVILRFKNIENLEGILRGIAEEQHVSIVGVDEGWIGDFALGSGSIESFVDPRILLVGGSGTFSTSFGVLWHTLDVTVDIPHTVIDLDSLGRVELSHYRTIILPHGRGYGRVLQGDLKSRLAAWIRDGGTLIAIRGAADALRDEENGLTEVALRNQEEESEEMPEPGTRRYTEIEVPGAAFSTEVRRRDYLSFGIPEANPAVLIEGSTALELAPYGAANIVTIANTTPLIAGLAWPESIDSIAGSAWLTSERVGSGRIITFAGEPHYRLFWKGTLPFFLNAAIYTPSFID